MCVCVCVGEWMDGYMGGGWVVWVDGWVGGVVVGYECKNSVKR